MPTDTGGGHVGNGDIVTQDQMAQLRLLGADPSASALTTTMGARLVLVDGSAQLEAGGLRVLPVHVHVEMAALMLLFYHIEGGASQMSSGGSVCPLDG